MSDDSEEFFAKHVAGGPSHVVVARAVGAYGVDRDGIFSTLAKAKAWADTLEEDEYHGVVFIPYVIDVPEFGNVPKGERQ